MELPAAKTVPPLLLLRALNGDPDLECLPLSLLSKWPGLAGGQSEAFRERFSLAPLFANGFMYLRLFEAEKKNAHSIVSTLPISSDVKLCGDDNCHMILAL